MNIQDVLREMRELDCSDMVNADDLNRWADAIEAEIERLHGELMGVQSSEWLLHEAATEACKTLQTALAATEKRDD